LGALPPLAALGFGILGMWLLIVMPSRRERIAEVLPSDPKTTQP
jgi:hypothetical protein